MGSLMVVTHSCELLALGAAACAPALSRDHPRLGLSILSTGVTYPGPGMRNDSAVTGPLELAGHAVGGAGMCPPGSAWFCLPEGLL